VFQHPAISCGVLGCYHLNTVTARVRVSITKFFYVKVGLAGGNVPGETSNTHFNSAYHAINAVSLP